MSDLRPAAVAGSFYPDRQGPLRASVEEHLSGAPRSTPRPGRIVKAVIAPHAGYRYSGPVAASAFRAFEGGSEVIRRIVLLGPAHHLPVQGLALPGAAGFETPLGIVPVDAELVGRITGLRQVSVHAAAHGPEHSLEVELPFLQTLLGSFTILPLLVGTDLPTEVSQTLDRVWGGAETRIVVSSDLSHYLSYDFARQIDRQTATQIVDLEAGVTHRRACGASAINGLLISARQRGLAPELVDLRNSGDTSGDRSRVVGYGAFAFYADT